MRPMLLPGHRRGFTLVEIMVAIFIMVILFAIAVPNFIRARDNSRARACQDNMKKIQGAKEHYMMDNNTTVPPATVAGFMPTYFKTTPTCPSGGTYTVGGANTTPTCSVGNNGTAAVQDDHIL